MSQGFRIGRRTVLRGFGGIAVGLPALEIMTRGRAEAQTTPKRFFLAYWGTSTGKSESYTNAPSAVGPGFALPGSMKSLTPIQPYLSVVSGLLVPYAMARGIPAPPGGRTFNFHSTPVGPQVCGLRADGSGSPKGPTVDQVIGGKIGGTTKTKVVATGQPRMTPDGGIGDSQLGVGGTAISTLAPKLDPQAVFASLFTGIAPAGPIMSPSGPPQNTAPNPADVKAAQFLMRQRKSVLDFVADDTERLMMRVGTPDRIRLQKHLEELRALEKSLVIPTSGGTMTDPTIKPAAGCGAPQLASGANYLDTWNKFSDLAAMAFACDLTRSWTHIFTQYKSRLPLEGYTGYNSTLHDVNHGAGGATEHTKSIDWCAGMWGKLAQKLMSLKEGAGNVLDNTVMVLVFEGGGGFDPQKNGNSSHSSENMMILLAGKAGGLKPKHVVAKGKHPANVMVSAMNAVGVMDQTLGEVTGPISELFS